MTSLYSRENRILSDGDTNQHAMTIKSQKFFIVPTAVKKLVEMSDVLEIFSNHIKKSLDEISVQELAKILEKLSGQESEVQKRISKAQENKKEKVLSIIRNGGNSETVANSIEFFLVDDRALRKKVICIKCLSLWITFLIEKKQGQELKQ